MPPKKAPKPPKEPKEPKKKPSVTTVPSKTLTWASDVKSELTKLKQLMQQHFSEAVQDPR